MIRDPDFMTVRQVAELCRVSRFTVHRWITEGRIEARRLGPKTIRIPASEVKRFLKQEAVA